MVASMQRPLPNTMPSVRPHNFGLSLGNTHSHIQRQKPRHQSSRSKLGLLPLELERLALLRCQKRICLLSRYLATETQSTSLSRHLLVHNGVTHDFIDRRAWDTSIACIETMKSGTMGETARANEERLLWILRIIL